MDYLGAKSRVQWRAFVNTVMNSKTKLGREYILTRLKLGEDYYHAGEDKLAHNVLKKQV
jgi:hypothetical protein